MSDEMHVADHLMYSTVRIWTQRASGQIGSGTGFFFRFLEEGDQHVPVIVTNKHVVRDSARGGFLLHSADADGSGPSSVPGDFIEVDLDNFGSYWIEHPDAEVDLCCMLVGALHRAAEDMGKSIYYSSASREIVYQSDQLAELLPLEDVVMVGYPTGIADNYNNRPIFRRGVTATHPGRDYEGRSEFLIDAPCFPGSSGSPVFLYNQGGYGTRSGFTVGARIALLGVLYAGPMYDAEGEIRVRNIPTQQVPVSRTQIPVNLGNVIKGEKVLELEETLRSKVRSPASSA